MNVEFFRNCCLAFPHTTESVQWGDNLVFKVAGKIFCIAALEPEKHLASFKCTAESFADLTERSGIVPAPYMARMQWVALELGHPLSPAELRALLSVAYDLVFAKLSKKEKAALVKAKPARKKKAAAKRKRTGRSN